MLLFAETAEPWSTGWSRFIVQYEGTGHSLVVAVECRLGSLDIREWALLDTGAQWSLLGGDTVEMLAESLGEPVGAITMSTRLGKFDAHLRPLSVVLLAEHGKDLLVDATVAVAPEWDGPIVLGYRGLLERVRIALDPGVEANSEWFAFAAT